MGNRKTREEDRAALEKKVVEKRAGSENPKGENELRRLHKRLKRVQRKIRGKAARIAQAAGKKSKAA